jgi:hypothetical protein
MALFDKIKSVIGLNQGDDSEFEDNFNKCIIEYDDPRHYFFVTDFSKSTTFTEVVNKWEDSKKVLFIIYLLKVFNKNSNAWRSSADNNYKKHTLSQQLTQYFLKSKMKITENELVAIYQTLASGRIENDSLISSGFISGFFKQVANNNKATELPVSLREILEDVTKWPKASTYNYKSQVKLVEKINAYLFESNNSSSKAKPTYFLGNDAFKEFANKIIDQQPEYKRDRWFELVALAQKASGAKPTQKYLNEAKVIIDRLGKEEFKKITHQWFKFVVDLKEVITNHGYYNSVEFLEGINADAIKGFVWMNTFIGDRDTILILSKLAERCYRKIPQKGPVYTHLPM